MTIVANGYQFARARASLGLAIALLLAGCGGQVDAPPPQRPVNAAQCHAMLDRLAGLKYRPLPDADYGPTCRLQGAVQLIDIGVVIRGIKAVSCPMTAGLHRWLGEAMQPAAQRHFGTRITGIDSYGSYGCRPRNNMAGAPPSEHSTANAIDIAAFRLADGRRITVLDGWNGPDPATRAFLRDVHGRACRIFQVVIGPDANAAHRDHLHFDQGRGPYCR